jgi:hypothetical protein
MNDWVDVLYSDFVKVENEVNGYGLVTFLVWHEVNGYFQVTEEIDVDGVEDVVIYYKEELEGTHFDWCRYSEDEWYKMHIHTEC